MAVLLIIGTIIASSVSDDFSRRLSRQYSIEAAARFQTSTNEHFVLMQQIARSSTISRWLADQHNQQIETLALEEIRGYVSFAPEVRLMFTFYESRARFDFFADGLGDDQISPWGVLDGGAISQWFYDVRDAEIPFTVNVQRERPSLVEGEIVLFVWSNHRMYYQGQFVGVVTVGSPFDGVFDAVFGDFDRTYKRGYIIDENARVRVDSAMELVVAELGLPTRPALPEAEHCTELHGNIVAHLAELNGGIFTDRSDLHYAIPISSDIFNYASIAPIIGTNWSVVVLSNHDGFFVGRYMPMVWIGLLLIVVSFFGGDIVVQKMAVEPLGKLSQSVVDADVDDASIYGLSRQDEIGDVARAVKHMQDSLKDAAKEMMRVEVAEESNRAKSQFLARMSHELRTPIAAVMGVSEIQLQNTDLPKDVGESFAKIHDSANFLIAIIDDLLDLSKIEAGKIALRNEEYGVASMLSEVMNLHLSYLEATQIDFQLHVDERLPAALMGDQVRIVQIMSNLLSNAFKYTESGSVEIVAKCEKIDSETVMLVMSVSDTGYGIPPERLSALREEYKRFHEQQNRFISGTGLGMSIVYNLVEMMGAELKIESEVDVGTTITVYIPQKIVSNETLGEENAMRLERFEANIGAVAKRFDFAPISMPYGRVLVVDDVQINLEIAQRMLEFYDLEIELCTSGREAIDKISQGKTYDIVLMDYMMPEMTGIETLYALRDMGYAGTIVAFTANAIIGQAEEFISHGFDGFMSKPIQPEILNELLIKYIYNEHKGQPPEGML